jgi:hypothetical protein
MFDAAQHGSVERGLGCDRFRRIGVDGDAAGDIRRVAMTDEPKTVGRQEEQDVLSGFSGMLQAFQSPAAWRLAGEGNWVQFWRGQDVILTCMETFADGWFRRRHVATETALDTALRCCGAATPFDVAREMLTWSMGSMARVMQDGLACERCCMALANLTPHTRPEAAEPAVQNETVSSETAEAKSGEKLDEKSVEAVKAA